MLDRMNTEKMAGVSGGRKPFTVPAALAPQANAEEAESLSDLSESTPLSALIAQLQNAEAQHTPQAPVVAQESVVVEDVEDISDDSMEEVLTSPQFTVYVSDAPVSTVNPTEQRVYTQERSFQTPAEPEPVVSSPRIVCVNRECTTAVYVASSVPTNADLESETVHLPEKDEVPVPEEIEAEDTEQNLYSIRNFYI